MAAKTKAKPAARRPKRRRVPIGELEERNLEYRRETEATRGTLCADRRVFRRVKRLGAKWVDELERPDFIRRYAGASRGDSPATLRGELAYLMSILNRGVGWGLVGSMPPFTELVRLQRRPRFKSTRIKAVSPADVDRLLEFLEKDRSSEGLRIHALVAIVALTGIGLAQAVRLRVEDIDLERGTIRIVGGLARRPSPGSPAALVKIDPRDTGLRKALASWLPETGSEWAFPGMKRLGPWSLKSPFTSTTRVMGQRSPLDYLESAAREVGIEGINFESLRRYFIENAVSTTATVPAAVEAAARRDSAASPDRPSSVIRLGRVGEPVYIDGKKKPPLRQGPHDVVSELLDAGRAGLSLKKLKQGSGHGGCWRMLKALAKDADWRRIIVFPGSPWGRYRIDARRDVGGVA